MWLPAAVASVSPESAHNFFLFFFLVLRRRKQNSSLARGGNLRHEEVVDAHCFLYVTSTLVRCVGRF